ncbi:MAG: DJ-1/PfpI family protein [Myxococcota bacterium]
MNSHLRNDSSSEKRVLEMRSVAILATDGVELDELLHGRQALSRAGAHCLVVGPKPGRILGFRQFEMAGEHWVESPLDAVDAGEFDALFVPGGTWHADALRATKSAVSFVQRFAQRDKPIAVLGHAVSLLVEADLVEGHDVSGAPSLRTDLENAGGRFIDRDVVADGSLLSGRAVPAFYATMIERFAHTPAPLGSIIPDFLARLLPGTRRSQPASDDSAAR